jgi:hypothetical protein
MKGSFGEVLGFWAARAISKEDRPIKARLQTDGPMLERIVFAAVQTARTQDPEHVPVARGKVECVKRPVLSGETPRHAQGCDKQKKCTHAPVYHDVQMTAWEFWGSFSPTPLDAPIGQVDKSRSDEKSRGSFGGRRSIWSIQDRC